MGGMSQRAMDGGVTHVHGSTVYLKNFAANNAKRAKGAKKSFLSF